MEDSLRWTMIWLGKKSTTPIRFHMIADKFIFVPIILRALLAEVVSLFFYILSHLEVLFIYYMLDANITLQSRVVLLLRFTTSQLDIEQKVALNTQPSWLGVCVYLLKRSKTCISSWWFFTWRTRVHFISSRWFFTWWAGGPGPLCQAWSNEARHNGGCNLGRQIVYLHNILIDMVINKCLVDFVVFLFQAVGLHLQRNIFFHDFGTWCLSFCTSVCMDRRKCGWEIAAWNLHVATHVYVGPCNHPVRVSWPLLAQFLMHMETILGLVQVSRAGPNICTCKDTTKYALK